MANVGGSSFFAARHSALAWVLAAAVTFPLRSDAESSRVRINIAGAGTERCDAVASGRVSKEQVIVWVEGFWSGLNYVAAASDQKQSIADTDLMMAEVEKVCRKRPSQILATAAWTAFLTLNER
jgi:hypothetical protein